MRSSPRDTAPDKQAPVDRAADAKPSSPDTGAIILPGPDASLPLVRALLLVGVHPLQPGDLAIKNRLERTGYAVNVHPVASADSAQKAGDEALKHHVVVVSTTYSAAMYGGASLRAIPVGIVCMEQGLFPPLGMVPADVAGAVGASSDQLFISVVDSASPLAAGLSTGPVKVTVAPGTFTWGRPPKTALTIAVLPAAKENALIFAYDRGALLAQGSAAPGRRVGFFADVKTVPTLNSAGLALFDAAVRWAAAP
jgi:hypothetical protein